MKQGTISDRNLVNILEYFKSKAEGDMGMMCTDEPILSNGNEILEIEPADAFGQYLMPGMIEQGPMFTPGIEGLERSTHLQGHRVIRQIFKEQVCQNDLNEERQDEGQTNVDEKTDLNAQIEGSHLEEKDTNEERQDEGQTNVGEQTYLNAQIEGS